MSGANFRLTALRDLRADVALVAGERLEHRLGVAAAERDHVDGRELQIGRQAHLGDRDHVRGQHVVVDVAARQHLGELVADQLADAQLALRRGFRLRDFFRIVAPLRGWTARGLKWKGPAQPPAPDCCKR